MGIDVNQKHYKATPLYNAASSGHVEIVRLLLENGANPNITSYDWEGTPLATAARSGNKLIVELLLKHGADTTIQDSKGETALDKAKKYNHVEIIQILTNPFSNS